MDKKKQTPAILQAALQGVINRPRVASAVPMPEPPKKNMLLPQAGTGMISAAVERARSLPAGGGMMTGPLTATTAPMVGQGGMNWNQAVQASTVSTPEDMPQEHPLPPPELLQNVQWNPAFAPLLGEARARLARDPNNEQAANTVHALEGALNIHNAKQTLSQDEGVMLPGGVVLPRGLTDRETAPGYMMNALRDKNTALQNTAIQQTADHKVAMENATVPSHMTRRKQNIAMGILLIAAAFGADPRYMNEVTGQWVQSIQELDDRDLAELKAKMQADFEKVQAGNAITENDIKTMFDRVAEISGRQKAEADTRATITAAQIQRGMEMDDATHAAEVKMNLEREKQKGRMAILDAKDITPAEKVQRLIDAGYTDADAREMVAAGDRAKLAQAENTRARTQTENATRDTKVAQGKTNLAIAREKLKWLPKEKQAALDKIAAGIAKSQKTGDSKGAGVGAKELRLRINEELKSLGAQRRSLQAMLKATPGDTAANAELSMVNSRVKTLMDYQRGLTEELASPKADAPNSGAIQYSMPVQGRVSSRFGARSAPKAGASTMHGGEDIAVPTGTKVKAAAEGRVIRAEANVGKAGTIVVIQHADGSTTHYFHLSGLDVKVGDTVKRGQVVARSGATGNVTGPHLHFEIRDPMGHKLDPAKYLR